MLITPPLFIAMLVFSNQEQKLVEELIHRMVKRAIEMEGTCTGEHGIGLVKRDYLPHEVGESTVDAMRKVYFSLFSLPFLLLCIYLANYAVDETSL